ncbi:MAG: hypothetical protein JWP87_5552 [Labilithrix sp.]|nr:hypothetical protein [Labilithrix sp.]
MDRVLVRSAMLRIVFVVLLVLLAAAGSAHAAPAEHAPARIAGALFTPVLEESGIRWNARWVLTPESAEELDAGETRALRFAVPLLDGETVEPTWGVAPLMENGRITGVLVDRAGKDDRTIAAVVHQRAAHTGAITLGAPVAAGSALQIIDGDLGAGTRYEIETGALFERGVGHVAPPGTSHAARAEARRLTGYDARVTGAAMYVRGEDVRVANGLTASVVTARARGHRGVVAVGVVFVALVLALFAAVRRLRHAAGVERADALLAAEVDALDGGKS